ncbi:MAG: DUF4159 domain-containing protein [Caldilineaceae bacterium]|nr:DUF4159 domain-containing protein [Caldilineaceae bacterium]
MFTREVLGLFPSKRIRAVDGMAVTADVWEEAHDYHRQLNRLHTLLHHGAGIVTGLEVIASDPADSSVYLLPGLAVDSIGQTIVVPEPRAYDLGNAEGRLYLIVSYNESRPQSGGSRVQEDAPLYVQAQYSLEAVTDLPPTPHVELARVWRRDQTAPITVAKDASQPRGNEIDLRFRRVIGRQSQPAALVGVVSLRGTDGVRHGEGMSNLAASIRLSGAGEVWVDRGVPLLGDLARYDLIYLIGRDQIQLTNEEMTALYTYWQAGGVIFFESCRRDQAQGDPPADAIFVNLVNAFGVQMTPLESGHALFRAPFLFAQPPLGFETQGSPQVRVADGLIMSTADYGCLWRGERRGRPGQRGEIRDAQEWGANLVLWAIAQRQLRTSKVRQQAP